VKFCIHVAVLSGEVFSPFGEHWLAGSHEGGGISSRQGWDRRIVLVVIYVLVTAWSTVDYASVTSYN